MCGRQVICRVFGKHLFKGPHQILYLSAVGHSYVYISKSMAER